MADHSEAGQGRGNRSRGKSITCPQCSWPGAGQLAPESCRKASSDKEQRPVGILGKGLTERLHLGSLP